MQPWYFSHTHSCGGVGAVLAAAGTVGDPADDEKNSVLKEHVRSALQVIEDLLMAAMEDRDITTMWQRRLLCYQSLGTL